MKQKQLGVTDMLIPFAIWAFFVLLAFVFVYCCSKASGNADDPFRDVNNGGATVEDSFKQYLRDHPEVNREDFKRRMSALTTRDQKGL